MFKQVNKLTLVAVICFVVGSLCLMLNVLGDFFNLLFIFLFIVGLVLIFIKKIMDYNEFKNELTKSKESISVDMTLSSDGTFGLEDVNFTKKQLKEFKYLKREKRTVLYAIVLLLILSCFFAYRIIQSYIKF